VNANSKPIRESEPRPSEIAKSTDAIQPEPPLLVGIVKIGIDCVSSHRAVFKSSLTGSSRLGSTVRWPLRE